MLATLLQAAADDGGAGPAVWVLRILLFGGSAVSIAVYARRLVRRTTDRSTAPRPSPAPAETESPTAKLFRDAAAGLATDAPGPDVAPAGVGGDAGGRSGLFARRPEAAGPPVAELLRGVDLPCDLAPVVVEAADSDRFQAFVTHAAEPAEVGAAVADELERLGYTVASQGERAVAATRPAADGAGDDEVIYVVLVPHPQSQDRFGGQPYRSLPPASVVVEFTTTMPS